MNARQQRVAVIGGTGAEGSGIAVRLARAGHAVVIGSRDPDKAARVCAELRSLVPGAQIDSADNRCAVAAAEVVILTVPYSAQQTSVREVQSELAGKILVDATAPLCLPR
jgi:NADPH-dependent F420 reductase